MRSIFTSGGGPKARNELGDALKAQIACVKLESGTDIRTIQQLPGHSDLKTTMLYTHIVERGALGARSPLDR
jgi:integrase